MKKFLLFSLLVGLFGGSQAQDLKPIKLNQPNVKRGLPVMTALQKRQSTREYADKKLELQDLSDLLWASSGEAQEQELERQHQKQRCKRNQQQPFH